MYYIEWEFCSIFRSVPNRGNSVGPLLHGALHVLK